MKKIIFAVLSLLVVAIFLAGCGTGKAISDAELEKELSELSPEELDAVIEEAESGDTSAVAGQAFRFVPAQKRTTITRVPKQRVAKVAYKIKATVGKEQSSGTYAQAKCSNLDGDLDYDGVPDTIDQCPFTPFAMSIIDVVQGDPHDFTLWQGAKITLTDLSISSTGEALAHVTIEKQGTGETMSASVGAQTPLALGGVISGLKGKLLLRDWRWVSNPNGAIKRGYAAIMATSNVNINTGCNPEGERSFP